MPSHLVPGLPQPSCIPAVACEMCAIIAVRLYSVAMWLATFCGVSRREGARKGGGTGGRQEGRHTAHGSWHSRAMSRIRPTCPTSTFTMKPSEASPSLQHEERPFSRPAHGRAMSSSIPQAMLSGEVPRPWAARSSQQARNAICTAVTLPPRPISGPPSPALSAASPKERLTLGRSIVLVGT